MVEKDIIVDNNCFICKKLFASKKMLTLHIRNDHNYSDQEYYDICFPNQINHCSCGCGRAAKWNKHNKTYNKYHSKSCASRINAINTHKKYPDLAKRMGSAGLNSLITKNPNHQSKAGKIGYQKQKENHPELFSNLLRSGKLGSQHWGKHTIYNNVKFKSSYESNFAKLCDENKIPWEYEPITFNIYRKSNHIKSKNYTPDFMLPSLELFVEIKPRKFINEEIIDKLNIVVEHTGWDCILIDPQKYGLKQLFAYLEENNICWS